MIDINDWLNELPWYIVSLASAVLGATGSFAFVKIRTWSSSKSESRQRHRDHGRSSSVSFHVQGDLNLTTGGDNSDKTIDTAGAAIVTELLRRANQNTEND